MCLNLECALPNGEEENAWARLSKHRHHQQHCQLRRNATLVVNFSL